MYPDTTQTIFDAPPTTREGTSPIEKVSPSSRIRILNRQETYLTTSLSFATQPAR